MASLGFRTIDEMVGRVDCIVPRAPDADVLPARAYGKTRRIDCAEVLYRPKEAATSPLRCVEAQDHNLRGVARPRASSPRPSARSSRGEHVGIDDRRSATAIARSAPCCRGEIAHALRPPRPRPTTPSSSARAGRPGQSFGALASRGHDARSSRATPTTTSARASRAASSAIAPPRASPLPPRRAGHRRQHGALRRHVGPRVLPRPRRRALRGAQQRRHDRRRRRRRSRLRVHDRRHRRRARHHRAQLRRRHERRRRLRLRRGRRCSCAAATRRWSSSRPSTARTRRRCARSSRSTRAAPPARRRRALLDDWETTLRKIVKVLPSEYRRVIAEQAKMPRDGRARRRRSRRGPITCVGATDRRRRARERCAMGKLRGFIEIAAAQAVGAAGRRAAARLARVRAAAAREASCAIRARAAWTAASPSATTAVRSGT